MAGYESTTPRFPDDRHAGKMSYALQAMKEKESLRSSLFVSPATPHFYIFPFPHGKRNSPRLLLLNRYSYFFFFGLKAFMA